MKKILVVVMALGVMSAAEALVSKSFVNAANKVIIKTSSIKVDCKKTLSAKMYQAVQKTSSQPIICSKMRLTPDLVMTMTELALGNENMLSPWEGDEMLKDGIFATGKNEMMGVFIMEKLNLLIFSDGS